VLVALDDELGSACAEAARLAAALGDEPIVVVLAGARDERVDGLLPVRTGSWWRDRARTTPSPTSPRRASPRRRPGPVVALAPAAPARALAATGVALVAPLRAGDRGGPAVSNERGQAADLPRRALLAVLVGVLVLGGVARGVGKQAEQQRAADLAALAGAQAMHEAYPRLFEPAYEGGRRTRAISRPRRTGRSARGSRARRRGATAPRTRPSPSPMTTRSRRCGSRLPPRGRRGWATPRP
jgi:hypothetical protein